MGRNDISVKTCFLVEPKPYNTVRVTFVVWFSADLRPCGAAATGRNMRRQRGPPGTESQQTPNLPLGFRLFPVFVDLSNRISFV